MSMRSDRRLTPAEQAAHTERAQRLWNAMTTNDQTAVRFGMFPAHAMAQVGKEGFDEHHICLALMTCATADGGMRA